MNNIRCLNKVSMLVLLDVICAMQTCLKFKSLLYYRDACRTIRLQEKTAKISKAASIDKT